MQFEWDSGKAQANLKKHGVGFDEAQTVFFDPLGAIFDDKWHSADEPRELLIGRSVMQRLLIVSFTEREEGTLRIISARELTRQEQADYERNRKRS